MLDTTPNLDKIVLQNSAILNINVNLDVSDIETDNTSLVYVSASRTLQIGNLFDGNKYVTSSATLQPARNSDVTFEKWSFIMGTLDIRVCTVRTTSRQQYGHPSYMILNDLFILNGKCLIW